MREVKVKRDDLLEALKKNRDSHMVEYVEACQGYRKKALAKIDSVFADLRGTVEQLKEGETIALISLSFGLDVPRSHERDYDQVIRMMEMSVDDVVTLKSDEFSCFVMDDWDWKQSFLANTSQYK